MKPEHEFFSSGELSSDPGKEVDHKILRVIQHMDDKLGVGPEVTRRSLKKELSRGTALSALNYLTSKGVTIEGARVLDLGAGLGKLSVEAALHGAQPVAVEPGHGLGEIISERLASEKTRLRGAVVAATGEQLPFRDGCFDIVISLQVLEHVRNPYEVVQEAFRVLKPGGSFYLTCENYLSFWEPHYNVAWLPLMPKPLGSFYLRLRGRSPEFLNTSITYTTFPSIRSMLKRSGFNLMREQDIKSVIDSPSVIKTRWKRSILIMMRRLISAKLLASGALMWWLMDSWFRCGVRELGQKPYA